MEKRGEKLKPATMKRKRDWTAANSEILRCRTHRIRTENYSNELICSSWPNGANYGQITQIEQFDKESMRLYGSHMNPMITCNRESLYKYIRISFPQIEYNL